MREEESTPHHVLPFWQKWKKNAHFSPSASSCGEHKWDGLSKGHEGKKSKKMPFEKASASRASEAHVQMRKVLPPPPFCRIIAQQSLLRPREDSSQSQKEKGFSIKIPFFSPPPPSQIRSRQFLLCIRSRLLQTSSIKLRAFQGGETFLTLP